MGRSSSSTPSSAPSRLSLGSPECGVDLYALTVSGTVDSAAGQRSFVDADRGEPAGYFNFGKVIWTGGLNAGISAEIKGHAEGGVFTLWPRLSNPIQAGDTYNMEPGCDGLVPTCKETFNNYLRFGGFDLPGEDAIRERPDAK
jgi:uncharacterized phage protein (TIGR02218 family)